MEGLGGYASSSGSDDEADEISGVSVVPSTSTADPPGAALAAAAAARGQRVAAMEKSDSDDSDESDESDDSDDSDDDDGDKRAGESKRGGSTGPAVALPSASDLMSGGGNTGEGIYHNPYEQQEIHTKRKLGDNDDNTIFKKVQGKKKVYGQGQKPKTNSSVARSWYAPTCPLPLPRLYVTWSIAWITPGFVQDFGWWRTAATSTIGARPAKCCDRGHSRVECYEEEGRPLATLSPPLSDP